MAVVKIIELVGSSPNSWEDAAKNALAEAGDSVRNINGLHVVNQTASITDGKITAFKANVKIAFTVDDARD